MNRILVITDGESDLLRLLKTHCDVDVISTEAPGFNHAEYDALCILAGNRGSSLNPAAPIHASLEKMREEGKPVFLEFLGSIGAARGRGTESTDRQRMVYMGNSFEAEGLCDGDLLDGQSNSCIKLSPLGADAVPILSYHASLCAHTHFDMDAKKHREGKWALLWMDKTTLVCTIRICNFRRARFAPRARWEGIIASIISHLAGERVNIEFEPPVCSYHVANVTCVEDMDVAVRRGIDWITNSDMLKDGGAGGAREGFVNRISAQTGVQAKNNNIRTDCTCELGGALLFDSYVTGNEKSQAAADALFKFAFDWLQVKDGEHRGMLRWSEAAWDTCFQDDAARAILPLLLCQHFGREIPYFEQIREALDYMLDTTGEDGIRAPCTEMWRFTPEYRASLKKAGSEQPCAHFNAFYHATLLLAYRVCGKSEYLDFAVRGLTTIMSCYPETRRETSETEECARLVLPLAVLYGVTGKQEHYDWICRVVDDLQAHRHPSGGYAEWDTGYTAFCSRNHNGECALLADNGDPVADLLYSNNWLPLGFSYAYLVTGEARFYDLWRDIASFMVSSQIHSEDKLLDGAWARAFDMDIRENYGMPHDVGWGPFCIESGWSVGEILMGLQFMYAAEGERARLK